MMPVAKPKDLKGALRRLAGLLARERLLIGVVVLLAVVSVALAVLGPKILGQATDILFEGVVSQRLPAGTTQGEAIAGLRAQGQDQVADMLSSMTLRPGEGVDFDAMGLTLLLLVGVYLLSAVFSWLQQYLMAGVAQRTMYELRQAVDEKLARLPLRYFDDHPRGDVLSRMTNDIDNISQTLQQTLTQLITAALTIVGVLVMMLWISWILALISMLVVPFSVIVTLFIARRSQKQFAAQWERTGDLNGHVEETFTGHNVVKVFGRQEEVIEAFDVQNEKLYRSSFRAQFISGTIQPVMNFVGNLNYVAVAVVGGVMVANGRISLGDVQAFIQYSRQFTMPIAQTASIMNVLQSAAASAERVFELLDEAEEEPEAAEVVKLPHTRGHITLRDVSFRYVPDSPLIEHLDLDVPPGQTVAIVGPTGAGKTPLVNLLLRFYELDGGAVLIDGVDSRQMSRSDLRRLFGMVLQDTWLFTGTIRENIAYGREGASEEEILAAARAARVDHFVRTLPDGYDTVLDDDATNVSEGEKQLLTIARAFLADPDVLILDEATSSVDTRTEVLIQDAMAELMEGRTSFVIAHRLSTIHGADTILVMDRGRIVEQGTHEELLARRGFYHDLYTSQFTEALVEAS
ncbi:MAG: ABC transporter ATP-binding protein [Thermoleophilia bacterium]|jgi:ATP-binding cassette subfamily B protein|nr:ABC transporter ATP-binding protein [Thermoleophilia bacterium]